MRERAQVRGAERKEGKRESHDGQRERGEGQREREAGFTRGGARTHELCEIMT